jgi:hypothetical protein
VSAPVTAGGFALPRASVAARVVLVGGEAHTGEIYVAERVPQHSGPETPLELLNRPDPFFAFSPKDGPVLLVAKAATVTVEVHQAPIDDPARRSVARAAPLEITLTGGDTLVGFALAELPEHHARPLDILNASTEPFFAVDAGAATHFVNRAHVRYARPQE